ncbi:hypothetical protein [Oceanobacillus sp. 1P07AA]|uniref:hypothetical protein n=1 Tax=Oceanobacillus sp. 1P07AA TaxID=3132293 RepID=UPI0039A4ED70
MGQLNNEIKTAQRMEEIRNFLRSQGITKLKDGTKIEDADYHALENANINVKIYQANMINQRD